MKSAEANDSWIECHSRTKNAKYWCNKLSNECRWIRPSEEVTIVSELGKRREEEWIEVYSSSKRRSYWYNRDTYASVWNKPIEQINEDYPELGIERDRLSEKCLDIFASEVSKYGELRGNSKTASSCRREGIRDGLKGMYGRILWTQLLRTNARTYDAGNPQRTSDAIFPDSPTPDEDVSNEFITFGRTSQEVSTIMSSVLGELASCHKEITAFRRKLLSSEYISEKVSFSSPTNRIPITAIDSIQNNSFYNIAYTSKVYTITGAHFLKIFRLYQLHTDINVILTDQLFLRRLFCCIARYETLSGNSDGYQMAFPNIGFQWLRDKLDVKIECFASPLNCWNQRFCSVARDTDRFFGSLGNFFRFEGSTGQLTADDPGLALGGSFESNPPFVESVIESMALRIDYLLTKYSNAPFSFVVIVPGWTDCSGIDIMTRSQFNRPKPGHILVLDKKKHNYRPGMQHRTQHEEQPSNVDGFLFFLQNDLGAKKWPVTLQDMADLKSVLIPK